VQRLKALDLLSNFSSCHVAEEAEKEKPQNAPVEVATVDTTPGRFKARGRFFDRFQTNNFARPLGSFLKLA
jgi:hypothetical protein